MQAGSAAPNACFSCYSGKRKCDRQMPVCNRCASNNAPCQYTCPVPLENFSHQFLQTVTRSHDHGNWGSVMHDPLYYLHQPLTSTCVKENIDLCLTSYLLSILARLNLQLEDVVGYYTRCMHQWLPIIHPIFLVQRAASLRDEPCAEFASLILHILLLNPPSVPLFNQLIEIMPLYEICKKVFSLLHTCRRDQLATIQSGLLLAIYEQGSGFHSDSYITLSCCASLGFAMGLHRLHQSSSVFEEERKRVWWSIYLLDRLFYHFDENSGRMFLIQSAWNGDELPVDDELWSNHTGVGPWDPVIRPLSDSMGTSIGGFAQQIQAVYFLDQVVQSPSTHPVSMLGVADYDLWRVDLLIRQNTLDLLNNPGKDWERSYRAIIILLLALIELHKKRLMCLGSLSGRFDSVRKSSIAALEMALNITRDITFMDDILNLRRMPLAAVFLLQKAGAVAVWLEKHFNHINVVLQPVTESLERASKRWMIASRISRELNAALIS